MFNTHSHITNAIKQSSPSYLSGTITFADGSTRIIGNSDIPVGGAIIEKRAVTGDVFEIGAAVIGELELKLITPKSEGRSKYYDAVLDLEFNIETTQGIETIPMGQWIFKEVVREKNTLNIIAYDNLIKLDAKAITFSALGFPEMVVPVLAYECGVELASDIDFYSLPNGRRLLDLSIFRNCTYRQVISSIAQMCGCYMCVDRYGKLVFKQFDSYPQTGITITPNNTYSCKLADYDYGINCVEVTLGDTVYTAYPENVISGTTLYLDNPMSWLTAGTGYAEFMTQQLADYFQDFPTYRPCDLVMVSDPRIDCGDRLTLYNDEGKSEILVTNYVWTFHGQMEISSVGKDPSFNNGVPSSSNNYNTYLIDEMGEHSIEESAIILHEFTNNSKVVSNENFPQIAGVSFLANRDTFVTFNGTMQVDVEVDDITEEAQLTVGDVTYTVPYKRDGHVDVYILYKFNSDWIGPRYKHTLTRGSHIITLHYPLISIARYSVNTFGVYISNEVGDVSIDKGMFVGTISGQGIAQALKWDGAINLEDFTEALVIPENNVTFADFDEQITYSNITRNDSDFSELVDIEITQSVTMVDINDTVQIATEEGE